jgi:hypothetical protein
LRMKQTKVRSAEPSIVPGEPAPDDGTAPGEPETGAQRISESAPEVGGVNIPPILLEGDEPSLAPKEGQRPKYADATAEPTRIEPAPSELPSGYGTGRLLLMARDPGSLYAHWDLTEEQQARHADQSVDRQLRLRVYRDALSGPLVAERPVGRESNHGFIDVGAGGIRYVAELGYQPQTGAWTGIAASEPVFTPSQTTSAQESVVFGTLRFDALADLGHEAIEQSQIIPPAESSSAGPLSAPLERQFPLPPPLGPIWVQSFPLSEATIPGWATEGEVPALPQSLNSAVPRQAASPGHRSGVVPAQAREWTEAQEAALAEIIGRSLQRREWLGSAEIEELIRGESRIPPSAEMGAVGNLGLVSSTALGQRLPEEPGFWLNVNAELVVYGATEPDARVTFGGRPVQLRADGTFSCRFALPDGFYQLAVEATSARGEMRQAELDFSRNTRCSGSVGSQPQDPALKPPLAT